MRGMRGQYLTDEERRNPPRITKALLARVFSWVKPYRAQMALVAAIVVLAAAFDLLPSLLTGRIIDEGLIGGNYFLLLKLIGASFGVLVVSNLIGVAESYLNTWVSQRIVVDMRRRMFAHLQTLSQRFYTSSRQGEAVTRMTSDIGGVGSVILSTGTSALSNVAVLITSVVAMLKVNWMLALVGIAIVPLFVLPAKMVGKRRWQLTLAAQRQNDEVNQILNETLSVSGQQLVKLCGGEAREEARYAGAGERLFALTMKENLAGRWFRVMINTFTGMGPMLLYLAAGALMLRYRWAELSVGDVTVMVALLTRMYRPVNQLLNIQVEFLRAMALFERIFAFFDLKPEVVNRPDAKVPDAVRGEVRFEHVSFGYDEEVPVLTDVDFAVRAGRTVAIVGPSGAGKSSLIHLIPRLYDATAGRITLDGVDVRDLDLSYLRGAVGLVSQDTYLFNATIRENLLYAKPDADEHALVRACKQANIHDFIASLPSGYDTVVGNRGIRLSGGERQRLSIARAILKDPAVLILDEATSSLDSLNEARIQSSIAPLMQARTTIVIAHRLSTIMSADEILVLENGRITERGTHAQLLNQNGCYAHLYRTQFGIERGQLPAAG